MFTEGRLPAFWWRWSPCAARASTRMRRSKYPASTAPKERTTTKVAALPSPSAPRVVLACTKIKPAKPPRLRARAAKMAKVAHWKDERPRRTARTVPRARTRRQPGARLALSRSLANSSSGPAALLPAIAPSASTKTKSGRHRAPCARQGRTKAKWGRWPVIL